MAIGTGQVAISDIAVELARGYGTDTNISLKDWSGKLWKGGPTNYASFKETRYYGSNCTFSTVVTAQGTGLAGMNASPYGMSEWRGYDHEIKSTIGKLPTQVNAMQRLVDSSLHYHGNNQQPSTHVVVHAGEYDYEDQYGQVNTVTSTAGLQVYCTKTSSDGGTIVIAVHEGLGNWNVGTSGTSGMDIQVLGGNLGAGQTTTDNITAAASTAYTLMTIVGADNITHCVMSYESSMPTDGPTQVSLSGPITDPDTNTGYGGSKIVTVTGGATSTTNLGSTKIGYDLCCGGRFHFINFDLDSVARTYGVEFTFTATNTAGVTMDTHKVTVYASLYAAAEHDERS